MAEINGETTDRAEVLKGFDPALYLQHFYSGPLADFTQEDAMEAWKMRVLHRAFTEGDLSGEVLVDVGSGPTLYQVLSGCEVFSKVILSDYVDANVDVLKRWLQNQDESSFDWTPFLQYACKLEGRVDPSAVAEKAARLRAVVSDVLHVDCLEPQPLGPDAPLPPGGADCLLSCFCIDAVALDMDTFLRSLRNIASLLRPGGHLLLFGALGMSHYPLRDGLKVACHCFEESEYCSSLKETGFTLIRMEVKQFTELGHAADVEGVIFMKAKKN